MRPRVAVPLDPADRAAIDQFSRRFMMGVALFIAALATFVALNADTKAGSSVLANEAPADVAALP
jgi:hypothetical protein